MDITVYTDEELVSLSLENKRFFAELVRRYEHRLTVYIGRLGRLSDEDTEDLLQEVFLAVYQNLNSFDSDLKFSSWIYRIAHNTTMAFFRKRRVRPEGHRLDTSEEVLAAIASELCLMRELEAKDDRDKVSSALTQLSERSREVLVLTFFEHKSYDEIADILMLPAGTVATRLHRAKEELRRVLEANGYIYG